MFIKRLFCKNHKWVVIKYTEYKDDTDRVIARETTYECKNCGKKYKYNHNMSSDYRL